MTARKQEANGQSSTPGRSFGPTPGRRRGRRKRKAPTNPEPTRRRRWMTSPWPMPSRPRRRSRPSRPRRQLHQPPPEQPLKRGSSKSPPRRGRRRHRLSKGLVVSREGAGEHVQGLPDEDNEDVFCFCEVHSLVFSRGECR